MLDALAKKNKQTFSGKVVKAKIPLLNVPVSRYLFSIVSENRCSAENILSTTLITTR